MSKMRSEKQERRGGIETGIRSPSKVFEKEGSRNAVVALKRSSGSPRPTALPRSRNAVVALKLLMLAALERQ